MNKWKHIKLGDVCIIERGGSPRPIKNYITDRKDGVNWIKIGDTSPNSMYITSTKEKIIQEGVNKSRFVKCGDFLLTNSMSFGRPYILKIDGCIHDGWLVLRDENNFFNKQFLYYLLSSDYIYSIFKNMVVGGVVNNLNSQMVRNLELDVPILDLQKKIVEALNKAKELIDKRKEQIENLDELVKSKFIEMFGAPLLNLKGWNEELAGDVCLKITDGSHFSPKDCPDSEIPMLSVKDMTADKFVYDKCKHVSKEEYEDLKKNGCKPLINDVLIAKDGSYFYYGFVVKEEREQALLSSIAILRPDCKKINPYYLRYYMMSREIVALVGEKYISGAALKRVILKGIRQIPVMIPPIEIQNEFAIFVKQVDKLKFEMEKSLKELQDNFDSLMQRAFSGELFN